MGDLSPREGYAAEDSLGYSLMEIGQIIHNNPVGYPADALLDALLTSIRSEISRVYWSVHQRPFYDAGPGDIGGEDREWDDPIESRPPLGIPGIEWWPYYNWGGSPDDTDWDQDAANRPNFSFEGVEVRWYKRFGRSLNVNVVWPAEKWARWFQRCLLTLHAWETQSGRSAHSEPTPYPDPAGRLSLEPTEEDVRHVELMQLVATLKAQLNSCACVCLDVAKGELPRATPEDWRWCRELEWIVKLGRHALTAPERFKIHDDHER